jgi:hypothetical protein
MGTLRRNGSVTLESAATPEQVWALLADVTRSAEWSHEANGGAWIDGATGAVPGARFRGRNRSGRNRWTRVAVIERADAPHALSWHTLPSAIHRDSTRWTYEIEPTDTGCRITQTFEVLELGPVIDRFLYAVVPAHRDRTAALAEDVRRLGEVAASAVATPA